MAWEIKHCEISEWLQGAARIRSSAMAQEIHVNQNIFACMQWMGRDVLTQAKRTAYSASLDHKPRAWVLVYKISQTVARIRGLYVEQEFRRQGVMSSLIRQIESEWKSEVQKLISFSTNEGLAFHRANGFQIVSAFIPRPVQVYDIWTGTYSSDPNSSITLFSKLLD